jgi:uncharacterized protein
MVPKKSIEDFKNNKEIAVIGASTNKKKFGYIVFNNLRQNNFNVFPVNPGKPEIDGVKCYADIAGLPSTVKAVIFVTKPEVTEKIAQQILENSMIEYLWFQPGSLNKTSLILTEKNNNKTIINGECILMFLKPSGFPHSMHRFLNKLFGKYPK